MNGCVHKAVYKVTQLWIFVYTTLYKQLKNSQSLAFVGLFHMKQKCYIFCQIILNNVCIRFEIG